MATEADFRSQDDYMSGHVESDDRCFITLRNMLASSRIEPQGARTPEGPFREIGLPPISKILISWARSPTPSQQC